MNLRKDSTWQHPFANLFKEFGVGIWTKSKKLGDVTMYMDKSIKCSVFHIKGQIPASNFIQIPEGKVKTMELSGRYFYLLFKPQPSKHFVFHIDAVTCDGLSIRLSFSTMYKQFRSTSCNLQFPFVFSEGHGLVCGSVVSTTKESVGPCPTNTKWTFLCVDTAAVLSLYLNKKYSHLKSVRICSTLTVKGAYTSSHLYCPGISMDAAKRNNASAGSYPIPREMSFFVGKNDSWTVSYDYIDFPASSRSSHKSNVDSKDSNIPPLFQKEVDASKNIKNMGISHIHDITAPAFKVATETNAAEALLQKTELENKSKTKLEKLVQGKRSYSAPLLNLKKAIGCTSLSSVFWANNPSGPCEIVYPSYAIIVALNLEDMSQRFFTGHGEQIVDISLDSTNNLMASCQSGKNSVIRIWEYCSQKCLAICRSAAHNIIQCISLSPSGKILVCLGKDIHGKNLIVVWNSQKAREGLLKIMAKTSTDISIHRLIICDFDESRFVSCGSDNIRFWRLKENSIRSAPVDLGEYAGVKLDFTGLCLDSSRQIGRSNVDRIVYVCDRVGHIFEINCQTLAVSHVRRLLPTEEATKVDGKFRGATGIELTSLCVNESFCTTGSADGYLRLWPLDFSQVFLEAEHEDVLQSCRISSDGVKILATTADGNIGVLDVTTRSYRTYMRSHSLSILSASVHPYKRILVTVSRDKCIRVWNLDTLEPLSNFESSSDCPRMVDFHTKDNIIVCGFDSGFIRIFDISQSTLISQQRPHDWAVTGLRFYPTSEILYSTDSGGNLVMYDSQDSYRVVKICASVACKGTERNQVLAVDNNGGKIAYISSSDYVVCVADARTLGEILRIDISLIGSEGFEKMDKAWCVQFGSKDSNTVMIVTENRKLIKVDKSNGKIIAELDCQFKGHCDCFSVGVNPKYVALAGDECIKIHFDSNRDHIEYQTYNGHSGCIRNILFTANMEYLVSVGETILVWETKFTPDFSENFQLQQCNKVERLGTLTEFEPITDDFQHGTKFTIFTTDDPPEKLHEDTDSPFIEELPVGEEELNAGYLHAREPEVKSQPFIPQTKSSFPEMHVHDPIKSQEMTPMSASHFRAPQKIGTLASKRYTVSSKEAAIELKSVFGVDGAVRSNVVWFEWKGLLVYSLGSLIIVEDIESGHQIFLPVHVNTVSVLEKSYDSSIIVSASIGASETPPKIVVHSMTNYEVVAIPHNPINKIAALSFSYDDRYLLAVGNYEDSKLVLWECESWDLVASSDLDNPVNCLRWDNIELNKCFAVGCSNSISVISFRKQPDSQEYAIDIEEVPAPSEITGSSVSTTNVEFSCCLVSKDMFYLASIHGRLSAWSVEKLKCKMHWQVDDSEITEMMTHDIYLYTCSSSGDMKIWNVEGILHHASGGRVQLEATIKFDGAINRLLIGDAGDLGIVLTTSGTLWYVSLQEYSQTRLITGHKSRINKIAEHNVNFLATGDDSGAVKVFDIKTRDTVCQFQVLDQACTALCFTKSLATQHLPLLAAGYSDGSVRIFDCEQFEMTSKSHMHAVAVTEVLFSADLYVLISGSSDGVVCISKLEGGMCVKLVKDHRGAPISDLDSQLVSYENYKKDIDDVQPTFLWLAASKDRRISVWAANFADDLCDLIDWITLPMPAFAPDGSSILANDASSYFDLPPCIARFSIDDPDLLLTTGYGIQRCIQFYSLSKRQMVRTIDSPHWASCLEMCPSLPVILLGSDSWLLSLQDLTSGNFQDYLAHSDGITCVKLASDGKTLFTCARNELFQWKLLLN